MVMKTLPRGSGQQTNDDSAPVTITADNINGIVDGLVSGLGKPPYTKADQYRRDCSTANLTGSSDTTVIASTTAATRISIFNGTGISIILKVATVTQFIIPPGGITEDLIIDAGQVMALNPYTTCTDGEIIINTFA